MRLDCHNFLFSAMTDLMSHRLRLLMQHLQSHYHDLVRFCERSDNIGKSKVCARAVTDRCSTTILINSFARHLIYYHHHREHKQERACSVTHATPSARAISLGSPHATTLTIPNNSQHIQSTFPSHEYCGHLIDLLHSGMLTTEKNKCVPDQHLGDLPCAV